MGCTTGIVIDEYHFRPVHHVNDLRHVVEHRRVEIHGAKCRIGVLEKLKADVNDLRRSGRGRG